MQKLAITLALFALATWAWAKASIAVNDAYKSIRKPRPMKILFRDEDKPID